MSTCKIQCTLSYKIIQPTNIIFMVQAAHHPQQTILQEQLNFTPSTIWHEFQDVSHQNRSIRLQLETTESFELNYTATVQRHLIHPCVQHYAEVPIHHLADEVLPYLLASRYCNSDLLMEMAQRSFGWMEQGYMRVQAIEQWIFNNIFYVSGSTNHLTTATDVLIHRAGVCRDFAHLGIALCRALGIPARIVVGYVHIDDFIPDFHAVFEAYLEGGWVLFDATRLAPVDRLVRIGTGIDAGDVAFATFYGELELLRMKLDIVDESF